MSRQVIIIGGGISGLAVLHYLRRKYQGRPEVQVRLLEKSEQLGGTIRTRQEGSVLFEGGPNGFLDAKDGMPDLIRELGMDDALLPASPASRERFISVKDKLHALPTGPLEFLRFQPLSILDKLRIPFEMFVPKGNNRRESVYDFGKRRLGENFSRYLLDPMVSGIYAGNAETLHLESAFPRIFEIEQKYGSLLKGMVQIMKERKRAGQGEKVTGQPAGRLTSLKKGMGQVIDELSRRYAGHIQTGEEATAVRRTQEGYIVETTKVKYFADEVIVSTPAYRAAQALEPLSRDLSAALKEIPYAPIAVVGLVYAKSAFKAPPRGFGYLVPSSEKKSVLGVLFSSNIFAGRADDEHVLMRVMIGGARNPEVVQRSEAELLALAHAEVVRHCRADERPGQHFLQVVAAAIPQYTIEHPRIVNRIQNHVGAYPGVYLAANYLGGISMNDCVKNAKFLVERLPI